MNRSLSVGRMVRAVLVIAVLAPVGIASGAMAALFLADQFLSGWIPSRWISTSASDWVFGAGTVGSARNYVGFMATGVAAAGCLKGVEWAVGVLRSRRHGAIT